MLYDVSRWTRRSLDQWEGAGPRAIYDKLRVRVSTLEGDVLAWTYVLVAYEGGLPSCQLPGPDRRGRREGRRAGDYVPRSAVPPVQSRRTSAQTG